MPTPNSSLQWPIPLKAVELIAQAEGCRLKAYRCPAGVWTCGWGETVGVSPVTAWTQAEADDRLLQSLTGLSLKVLGVCSREPAPNELGVMCSLAYNIGMGAFAKSTVLRAHNAGDHQAAARAFSLWDKATVRGVLQDPALADLIYQSVTRRARKGLAEYVGERVLMAAAVLIVASVMAWSWVTGHVK
jgi:GH24 family phage-related lysozyme (muramidase)